MNDRKIKVLVLNNPTKEESEKKTKGLSEFLSKTWHIKLRTR